MALVWPTHTTFGSAPLTRFKTTWTQYGPYLAFGIALTAVLGSLYYGEIAGFAPCTLCWYQRILMYPLALILLVGILKHDEDLFDYALPFSVLGMVVATYNYLIELHVIGHSAVCAVGIPCDVRYVNYMGFVTIPLMALMAFAAITGVMALGKWAGSQAGAAAPVVEEATE